MEELTQKRNQLAEWYGGMKHSSVAAWGIVSEGFVEAYGVMEKAFSDAAKEFD